MRPTQMPAEMLSEVVHPIHIDDAEVEKAIERAVASACFELDMIFPDAPPETKGISSEFQGLLREHVRAMLTGKPAANKSTRTHLPVLLASDNVFGEHFDLPAEQGAGYLAFNPVTREVLSAYSGKFVKAARLPDVEFGAARQLQAPLYFSFGGRDVDALFSFHDGATRAALVAMNEMGESPSTYPVRIIAAVYEGERDCFVEVPNAA